MTTTGNQLASLRGTLRSLLESSEESGLTKERVMRALHEVFKWVKSEQHRGMLPSNWELAKIFMEKTDDHEFSELHKEHDDAQTDLLDQLCTVERTLDVRDGGDGKSEECLVKWEGCGEKEATWEPEANLFVHQDSKSHIQSILKEFNEQRQRETKDDSSCSDWCSGSSSAWSDCESASQQ
mmetsp:Transcript_1005/g.1585  ORF Transcript_1005/g.1585 Transcript_1005/m.1585 type:complete len:181 (+) Transcript_1005:731-1273(+)